LIVQQYELLKKCDYVIIKEDCIVTSFESIKQETVTDGIFCEYRQKKKKDKIKGSGTTYSIYDKKDSLLPLPFKRSPEEPRFWDNKEIIKNALNCNLAVYKGKRILTAVDQSKWKC
jgi:hypothetical protein